ncbi:hypothetical protein M011DRAFT_522600 [Sporormia fimetaria CBS 119925]|uniref:Amino acid transporter n=1 Tax=Sporormia fimetaria CBS 119925 TaxID=1340428 RepID=A0A6A6UX47_9PLEO|nr:hypothetical protein M011DRAFT_522600 [Sporormia fimetaria CBS 119925]
MRSKSVDFGKIELFCSMTINESGHVQVMERQFGLFSLCCLAISFGCVWPLLGGFLVVALSNGGPAGVIYEFLFAASSCFAELASSIPSSSGTRLIAGRSNFFAFLFGSFTGSLVLAQIMSSIYAMMNPEYVYQRWHALIAQVCFTWVCCGLVMFCNRALALLSKWSLPFILGGFFVTVLVCIIMPSQTGKGYASHLEVWKQWDNYSGWDTNIMVFYLGSMGLFCVLGVPASLGQLAEEVPNAPVNLPKAQLAMYRSGITMGFLYLVVIFYAVTDRDSLFDVTLPFPLVEVYRQATDSRVGSLFLCLLLFLPLFSANVGIYLVVGRTLWTLARDNATPFPSWLSRIDKRFENPLNATMACGIFSTFAGVVNIASPAALVAISSAFALFAASSWLTVVIPNILTRRRYLVPGPFWMPAWVYYPLAIFSCLFRIVFTVIYCFPPVMPFDVTSLNWSPVMFSGSTLLVPVWWFCVRNKGYTGPGVLLLDHVVTGPEPRETSTPVKEE